MPGTDSSWLNRISTFATSWLSQPSADDPVEYDNQLTRYEQQSMFTWTISASLIGGFFERLFNRESSPKTLGLAIVGAAFLGGIFSMGYSSSNRRSMHVKLSQDITELSENIASNSKILSTHVPELNTDNIDAITSWARDNQTSDDNQTASLMSAKKLLRAIDFLLSRQVPDAENNPTDISDFWSQELSILQDEIINLSSRPQLSSASESSPSSPEASSSLSM